MEIDKRKIKVNTFSSEIEKPLKQDLRTYITIESDIYATEYQDNGDGTFNEVFKCRLVGSTIIKQQGQKDFLVGKSKRTKSQKLRAVIFNDIPEESYYDIMMDKLIMNWEEVRDFLKNK